MSDQPGYTRLPNDIIEAMPYLGNAELRVLLAIARKTIGFQKDADRISVSQIETLTGLTSRNAQRAIVSLLEKGYITREQIGKQAYSYAIQTISPRDTEQNHVPTEPISPRDTEPYPLGTRIEVKPYPLGTTQKKDLKQKKERESEGAKAPRKLPRTETQKPLNFAHEAVQIFKQLTGVRNVAPAMADRIAETVVDFPAWRDAVSNWLAAGFKPNNIGGMLDWYLHPDRQKRERKEEARASPNIPLIQAPPANAKPKLTAEETRAILAEYNPRFRT